jgi:hypothetical protein
VAAQSADTPAETPEKIPMSISSLVSKYAMIEALHVAASDRDWQPSAVEEFAKMNGELFDDQTRRHRSTGQSIEAFVREYERQRPHVLMHGVTDMDDAAMRLTAFLGDAGKRSLTDLGKLQNHLGGDVEALKAAALDFGITNPFDLKQRGVMPSGGITKVIDAKKANAEADQLEARAAALRKAADLTAPRTNGADHASNPWSAASGFNLTKQGALIKAIGVEKAARIAASVGCKIGDLRPNPNYK